MNDDLIKERVFKIISAIMNADQSLLNEATTAKEVEGWDSLKHMRLIMALEREFGVKFKPAQIIGMENVGAIIDYLRAK
jgi:acyl carrier protein